MNRLIFYFVTVWYYTKQLFGYTTNDYWVISEEDCKKLADYTRKVCKLEKENNTYISIIEKLTLKIEKQKQLIDILTEDKENN